MCQPGCINGTVSGGGGGALGGGGVGGGLMPHVRGTGGKNKKRKCRSIYTKITKPTLGEKRTYIEKVEPGV